MKPIRDDLPNTVRPQEHLDELRIVARLTTSPAAKPDQVEAGFVCAWEGLGVPLEEAARYATAVAWDEEGELFHPFVASQRLTQFEWGASGSSVEFVVDLVSNVSSELIVLGLGYAVGKIRGGKRSGRLLENVTDIASVRTLAVQATCQVFELEYDEVEVTEVSLARRTVKLRLKGKEGRFEAKMKRLDTDDPYVVVKRER